MIFYGACEETVTKEKAFAQRFGTHLRFLRLRCWSPAQGPALEAYLENVGGVLEVLSRKALLHEIHVRHLSNPTKLRNASYLLCSFYFSIRKFEIQLWFQVADVEGLGYTDDELITVCSSAFAPKLPKELTSY